MASLTRRQQDIVSVSIELISRKGIQELTIRNLARELGITEPAIYRHFAGKTEILAAMLEYLHSDVVAMFEHVGTEGSALSRLESYYRMLLERLASSPAAAAVVFSDEAFMNEERLTSVVRTLMERGINNTRELLQQAFDNKEIRRDQYLNADDLAVLLLGGIRLLVRRWHMDKQSGDLRSDGLRVLRSFLGLVEHRDEDVKPSPASRAEPGRAGRK